MSSAFVEQIAEIVKEMGRAQWTHIVERHPELNTYRVQRALQAAAYAGLLKCDPQPPIPGVRGRPPSFYEVAEPEPEPLYSGEAVIEAALKSRSPLELAWHGATA